MHVSNARRRVHSFGKKSLADDGKVLKQDRSKEKSVLMDQLGIIPNKDTDKSGIPDYLSIALNWYAIYDRSGEGTALLNYQHLIRVAEEFDMCYVLDAITMEEFLP